MDFQKELVADYERETAKTRKMLEAIPAEADMSYKPHPKSMTLGHLAGHLTDMTGEWAIQTLTLDVLEYPANHQWKPYIPNNKQEVLEKFDSRLAEIVELLSETTGEKWDQHWKFIYAGTTLIDLPRGKVFREMVLSHLIHHRAQLSVYLRLLGAKIPGLYGPSADEMP